MSFESDNTASVHPSILAAIVRAGEVRSASYGSDPWTRQLMPRFSELFEAEVAVHPVLTGTAANALALSELTPSWGAVLCHSGAHVLTDECGSAGYLGGGLTLVPLEGEHGKITATAVEKWLSTRRSGDPHQAPASTVSISQPTERGTVYTLEEIAALGAVCNAHEILLHMDGARFANALASVGCTPAEMTWKRGVDMLSFGATKNGAFAAEAVIDFRVICGNDLLYRRIRAGQLLSKMRLVSAQLLAYVSEGLWLKLAARANEAAVQISAVLAGLPHTHIIHPVQANAVFVEMPRDTAERLYAAGFKFFHRMSPTGNLYRLVTSHDTTAQELGKFLRTLIRTDAGGARQQFN